ncbi:conserved hypothetical protein [Methylocella tundrae]|uniref:Prophage minor tail protein Z (GPZ) n=1 Tax=Methylocella tundrae TaxID=227605 RepID=A0A8B6MCM7_METTU|nr:hypothetical protein [Methylocella tundrae]VTZ52501.1 conserved hypothetical protein [Methylocella tundrae]
MIALRVKVISKAGRFETAIPLAIARGLNEGGDKVRTQVQRALKTQTGVTKYASITSRMQDSGRGYARAAPGKLAYQIIAKGKGIPIKEFPVKDTGHAIDARTWGVDHVFKRSFGMPGLGVDGFRARLTDKRLPIRKLYGPSLPKELVKDKAAEVFIASAQGVVPAAVLKHLLKSVG